MAKIYPFKKEGAFKDACKFTFNKETFNIVSFDPYKFFIYNVEGEELASFTPSSGENLSTEVVKFLVERAGVEPHCKNCGHKKVETPGFCYMFFDQAVENDICAQFQI